MAAEGFLSLLHYLYDGEDDQIRRKVMRVQQVFHQVVTWVSLLVASPLILLSLYFQQWLSFGLILAGLVSVQRFADAKLRDDYLVQPRFLQPAANPHNTIRVMHEGASKDWTAVLDRLHDSDVPAHKREHFHLTDVRIQLQWRRNRDIFCVGTCADHYAYCHRITESAPESLQRWFTLYVRKHQGALSFALMAEGQEESRFVGMYPQKAPYRCYCLGEPSCATPPDYPSQVGKEFFHFTFEPPNAGGAVRIACPASTSTPWLAVNTRWELSAHTTASFASWLMGSRVGCYKRYVYGTQDKDAAAEFTVVADRASHPNEPSLNFTEDAAVTEQDVQPPRGSSEVEQLLREADALDQLETVRREQLTVADLQEIDSQSLQAAGIPLGAISRIRRHLWVPI